MKSVMHTLKYPLVAALKREAAEISEERILKHFRRITLLLAALLVGGFRLSASTWVAENAGAWGDSANWAGGFPGPDSDIAITGLARVLVGSETPAGMLTVQKLDLLPDGVGSPVLEISNLGQRPFLASDTMTLAGTATLSVEGSTVLVDGEQGGHFNFLSGEVSLVEGRIRATRGATLRVGRTGIGLMRVRSGEVFAEGDLIVGGLGGSSGVMEIQSGLVLANGIFQVADDVGSEGIVRVHGGQLVATNMTVRIGDDGRGSLEISGGTVRLGDVSVGRDLTGVGELSVMGGRVEAGDISLGRLVGSHGTASFRGGEVLLPADDLYVGRDGHGVLRLEGGTAHVSNVVVAVGQGASGVLEMYSGLLRTSHLNIASANATFRWEGGRIETSSTVADRRAVVVGNGRFPAALFLAGGEHVFPGGLVISSNAVLEGKGTVVGGVTVLAGGSNRLETEILAPKAPRLALSLIDGIPAVSLNTVVGIGYVVEGWAGGAPGWSTVARAVGTGGRLTVVDPAGRQSSKIYRARVE